MLAYDPDSAVRKIAYVIVNYDDNLQLGTVPAERLDGRILSCLSQPNLDVRYVLTDQRVPIMVPHRRSSLQVELSARVQSSETGRLLRKSVFLRNAILHRL